jgi:CRP-like cAMP-binding protein
MHLMSSSHLDHADRVAALRRVPLFHRLSTATLSELARRTDRISAPSGTTLVRQDEPGDHLGILMSGTAEVTCDGRVIGSLGAGEFFGEMALIDGEPRSATITTTSDAEMLRVAADDFDALLNLPHVARALLRGMCARLRDMQHLPPV